MSEEDSLKKMSEVDKILAKLKFIAGKLGAKDSEPGKYYFYITNIIF